MGTVGGPDRMRRQAIGHVVAALAEAAADSDTRGQGVPTHRLAEGWKPDWPAVADALKTLWRERRVKARYAMRRCETPRFLGPVSDTLAELAPFMATEVRRYGEFRSALTADEAEVFAEFDAGTRDKPHLWALAGKHAGRAPADSKALPAEADADTRPAVFHTDDLALSRGKERLDVTQDEVALLLLLQQKEAVPVGERIGSRGQKAASIVRSLERKGLGHLVRRRRGRFEATKHLTFKGHDADGAWIRHAQEYSEKDGDRRRDYRESRPDEIAAENEEQSAY